jgi:hypothetical protein
MLISSVSSFSFLAIRAVSFRFLFRVLALCATEVLRFISSFTFVLGTPEPHPLSVCVDISHSYYPHDRAVEVLIGQFKVDPNEASVPPAQLGMTYVVYD